MIGGNYFPAGRSEVSRFDVLAARPHATSGYWPIGSGDEIVHTPLEFDLVAQYCEYFRVALPWTRGFFSWIEMKAWRAETVVLHPKSILPYSRGTLTLVCLGLNGTERASSAFLMIFVPFENEMSVRRVKSQCKYSKRPFKHDDK